MELKDQLTALQGELKTFVAKANEEKTNFGTMQAETKSIISKLQTQLDDIDVKLASKHAAGAEQKSLVENLQENEDIARLVKDQSGRATFTVKGSAPFEQKTVITSAAVGAAVSGVLGIDRIPGIVAEARQTLRVRDLFIARPTTFAFVDFLKVTSPLSPAAMVPETTLKPDNAVGFAAESVKVQTIATTISATNQVLADMTELAAYLQDALPYAVDLKEEQQFLAGDGTNANLLGLIPQAQAYNSGVFNNAKDNRIDQIGHAIEQIMLSMEYPPTFIILNSADYWSIKLTKDGYGRYLLGDPQSNVTPALFGLTVVPTTTIAAGTFLVGSGAAPVAEIRDREETTVAISTEHSDYFQRNMVLIRAEKRVALVVKRPNAFVTGTFETAN